MCVFFCLFLLKTDYSYLVLMNENKTKIIWTMISDSVKDFRTVIRNTTVVVYSIFDSEYFAQLSSAHNKVRVKYLACELLYKLCKNSSKPNRNDFENGILVSRFVSVLHITWSRSYGTEFERTTRFGTNCASNEETWSRCNRSCGSHLWNWFGFDVHCQHK